MTQSLSRQRRDELLALTEKLGVGMNNLELLNQALRHSSYCNENGLAPGTPTNAWSSWATPSWR